jgi:dTDP-4-amino-4,6-dideoxygalactose transaminase
MPVMSRVPLIDLQAQYAPLREALLRAITRVCDSQRFILGPEVEGLEWELAALVGVEHAVAVSSGTDALLLALMTLGVGAGDEVVTSAFSFFATAGAIVRLGARPVFVDIDPLTFNLDPIQTERAVGPRTKAIVPVHLFGLSADIERIVETGNRAGVPVVEDAAQAIGATCGQKPVGGFGTLGCFSFYPTKNLGAFGDAGLLTSNDPSLAKRAQLLRVHGMDGPYRHTAVGGNFRMDALQAAVLKVKAPHLAAWTTARRMNASRYARLFREADLTDQVILPIEPTGRRHVYNQFVIRVSGRDGLKRHLDERGIASEIYYPIPFHLQPCFAGLGYRVGHFPQAERAARECLAIPVYAELTLEQQQAVVGAIAEFVHERKGHGAEELV